MSEIGWLSNYLNICCPYCRKKEYNEIDQMEVSITIDYTDVGRIINECMFEWECKHCGKSFNINPHMHVDVVKKE